jgi:hypothetical protein
MDWKALRWCVQSCALLAPNLSSVEKDTLWELITELIHDARLSIVRECLSVFEAIVKGSEEYPAKMTNIWRAQLLRGADFPDIALDSIRVTIANSAETQGFVYHICSIIHLVTAYLKDKDAIVRSSCLRCLTVSLFNIVLFRPSNIWHRVTSIGCRRIGAKHCN